jgi:lysozyme family protein
MTDDFIKAFNHTMIFEIGSQFDPTDPDVIAGNIETPQQRRKVGFTNVAGDRGGITKYGIAQNSHPEISVKDLTLQQAMEIYEPQYWQAGYCTELQSPVSLLHFDACVNHGIKAAAKFLQRAAGVTADGAIGSATLSAVMAVSPPDLAAKMLAERAAFFQRIVDNDPTQQKFLKGWLSRIAALSAWIKTA